MSSDVLLSKVANRQVPGVMARGPWPTRPAMAWLGRRMGGLWVGGRITLSASTLSFRPNAVNQAAHDGDTSASIPLQDVTAVEDRPGVFTKIVHVESATETIRFRCYGARAVSRQIRDAVDHVAG